MTSPVPSMMRRSAPCAAGAPAGPAPGARQANPQTPTGEDYRILRALPLNAYGIDPGEFYLT